MEKKSKYMIVIIVVMLLIFGLSSLSGYLNHTVKLGDVEFTLPEGFYKKDTGKSGKVMITDGENEITMINYDDDNIKDHIQKYEDYVNSNNQTVKIKNFKSDGVKVYKSTIKENPKVIHYWFNKDGKTYSLYTSKANDGTEEIILNLIGSTGEK